jgi:hypothetical protein
MSAYTSQRIRMCLNFFVIHSYTKIEGTQSYTKHTYSTMYGCDRIQKSFIVVSRRITYKLEYNRIRHVNS